MNPKARPPVFIGIIGNAGAGAPHESEGAASFREGVIISKERSRAVDADGPFLTDRLFPADHERRAQSPGVAVPALPVFREISVRPGEGEAAPERNGAVPLHFLVEMDRVIVDVAVIIKTVLYVFKLDLHGMRARSRRREAGVSAAGAAETFSPAAAEESADGSFPSDCGATKIAVGPSALPMTPVFSETEDGSPFAASAGEAENIQAQQSAARTADFIKQPPLTDSMLYN